MPFLYLPLQGINDSPYDRIFAARIVVYLVAHELRHLWQGLIPRDQQTWHGVGQSSEHDADAYAIGKVRHWRRYGSPFFGLNGVVSAARQHTPRVTAMAGKG